MATLNLPSPRLMAVATLTVLLAACSADTDPLAAFESGRYDVAFAQWLPLAEAGDAEAQNYLGLIYYLGLGQRRNDTEALKWFELAAEQGYPDAQRNTGIMYQTGRGMSQQDFNQAYIWFYAAHRQGNETANAHIHSLTNKLTPNQQMRAKELARPYIRNPVDSDPVSTRHFWGSMITTEDYRGE